MLDHRPPDPVVLFFCDVVGEETGQVGYGHRDGRQSAAVLGDRPLLPLGAENVANVGQVLLEEWMMWPDVTDARPSLQFAAAKDGRMLTGAAVIPTARAAYLSSELHEGDIERRLHEAPFALRED
jgi:hypothetical protein